MNREPIIIIVLGTMSQVGNSSYNFVYIKNQSKWTDRIIQCSMVKKLSFIRLSVCVCVLWQKL